MRCHSVRTKDNLYKAELVACGFGLPSAWRLLAWSALPLPLVSARTRIAARRSKSPAARGDPSRDSLAAESPQPNHHKLHNHVVDSRKD